MGPVHSLPFVDWSAASGSLEHAKLVEQGGVLYLPRLRFDLHADETRFLTPDWLDGSSKSVYLKGKERRLRGTAATGADRDALQGMVERFGQLASGLVRTLFPAYVSHLKL